MKSDLDPAALTFALAYLVAVTFFAIHVVVESFKKK